MALLFLVASPLRRAEAAEAPRISSARLSQARAFRRASPPHGLCLLEDDERLQLVTAPECS